MIAKLCPQCGSGKVDIASTLEAKRSATCKNCGWEGVEGDLISADVGSGSPLQIALEVSKEYMRLLAMKIAQPLGLVMIEAGIVGRQDSQILSRLLRAATVAAHRATLEEIEKIQKEADDARS